MDEEGYCEWCEGRCFWNVHKNVSWKIIREEVIEEITGDYLISKHTQAHEKKKTLHDQVL